MPPKQSFPPVSGDAPTLDAPPNLSATTALKAGPCMHLVEGSCGGISGETQDLLRTRLRMAALLLFMGFAAFFVWHLFNIDPNQANSTVLLSVQGAITLVLGFCGIVLYRHCVISTGKLRLKELVIFGLPAFGFLFFQYNEMTACATQHQVLPNVSARWLVLIFTYTMFIPNTWRRAAMVVVPMAIAPILLSILLHLFHAHCSMALNAGLAYNAQLVLVLSISAIASITGVHTIGSLRQEAFEAKQLGQYRLRHLLGRGGMGEVYLAEHQLMKRPCAIKIIHPDKAGDPRTLARFEREVRSTAKLSHWNSIEIFDYGRTDEGVFYYVMEYLPGMNFNELVRRHGPLPAERVIYLLSQTCAALTEAHEAKLIHRDIKPANIFAAQRGGQFDVAKLLDFGLAKPLAETGSIELTQEGAITGSPLFMAPEQAAGDEEPDPRSDIYSLGGVAYFLLTGQPPFDGEKPLKVILDHAQKEPQKPSQLQSDVPADLEQVVLRCLAKLPEDRYQSAAELQEALESCQAAGLWTAKTAAAWWRDKGEEFEIPEPRGIETPQVAALGI